MTERLVLCWSGLERYGSGPASTTTYDARGGPSRIQEVGQCMYLFEHSHHSFDMNDAVACSLVLQRVTVSHEVDGTAIPKNTPLDDVESHR